MTVRILVGHVLDRLAGLPENSVHMVWTSPPYWGLRTYGTEPQVWGGERGCAHEFASRGEDQPGGVAAKREPIRACCEHGFCRKCGAWRGEHGLEPDFDLWLAHEVEIFRAVRRVLRKDGTLFVNIGDAYATAPNGRSAADQKAAGTDDRTFRDKPVNTASGVFKAKDRLMMPARLAIALHGDGWYLRDEIVWHKLNPMPSSVRDRTTPAHEMIYMFSKSARYFYDRVAISEAITKSSAARYAQPTIDTRNGGAKQDAYEAGFTGQRARLRRPNEIIKDLAEKSGAKRKPAGWDTRSGVGHSTIDHASGERKEPTRGDNTWATRNKRSVWSLALEPFDGAHFATAPTGIVIHCILAGSSEKGVCRSCGAPWERQSSKPEGDAYKIAARDVGRPDGAQRLYIGGGQKEWDSYIPPQTTGWAPSCKCPDNAPVPATILDPFGGAGTTALVAQSLGRDALLIELNPEYARMARARLRASLHRVVAELPEDAPAGLPLFGGGGECG